MRLLVSQEALSYIISAHRSSLSLDPSRMEEVGHDELRIKCVPHRDVWQRVRRWGLLYKET